MRSLLSLLAHAGAGAALLSGCGGADATAIDSDANAIYAETIPVETLVLGTQSFDERYAAAGVIEAEEEVSVSAEIAGRITAVEREIGDSVAPGALLVQLDDRSQSARVAKLEAETAREETQLRWARRDLERQSRLYDTQVAAERARDDAQRLVETTEGNLAAVRADLEIARVELSHTRIASPIRGTVSKRYVSAGEYVTPGTRLYDLVATDTVKFVFSAAERDVTGIRSGQEMTVGIDAYEGVPFEGSVAAISPAGSQGTRTFRVELKIENDGEARLLPGMAGRADVIRRSHERVYLLPESAILRDGHSSYVYLVENDTAHRTDIEIIGQSGSLAVVAPSFDLAGDCIILGQAAVTEGTPVTVRRRHETPPLATFD